MPFPLIALAAAGASAASTGGLATVISVIGSEIVALTGFFFWARRREDAAVFVDVEPVAEVRELQEFIPEMVDTIAETQVLVSTSGAELSRSQETLASIEEQLSRIEEKVLRAQTEFSDLHRGATLQLEDAEKVATAYRETLAVVAQVRQEVQELTTSPEHAISIVATFLGQIENLSTLILAKELHESREREQCLMEQLNFFVSAFEKLRANDSSYRGGLSYA